MLSVHVETAVTGNRLISQNSCTCTREEEKCTHEVCVSLFMCFWDEIHFLKDRPICTYINLCSVYISCLRIIGDFKCPPAWPTLAVSALVLLIQSLIVTDTLKFHINNGMFGLMLPIANNANIIKKMSQEFSDYSGSLFVRDWRPAKKDMFKIKINVTIYYVACLLWW